MIELRDYQIEMLDRLQRTWREGKRSVMVQMPTGTGKTVMMAEVMKSLTPDPSPKREGRRLARCGAFESLTPDPSPKREGGRLARSEALESLSPDPSPKREGNVRVLVVAHRSELIQQIKETLAVFGIEGVAVESIQKLTNKIKNEKRKEKNEGKEKNELIQGIDESGEGLLIVIDEAHHALAKTYRALWERWPKAKFLGLTATPCRLDGTAFTDLFDVLLQSKDIQWFIKEGWLSDFEYVSAAPDSEEMRKVRGLKKRGADGDYQTKEMAMVMDCPESIEHLYNTYISYARGKKGIVYAIDRAHAQHIAEYYSERGVRCAVIDAKTPAKERAELIERYKRIKREKRKEKNEGIDENEVIDKIKDEKRKEKDEGKDKIEEGGIDVLINVDIFSEGFDCPEVEFIQLARPTLSLAKYLQQVGRGMRVSAGKPHVLILDQVGLYQTFGLPTVDRDWLQLFLGKEQGKGQADISRCVAVEDTEDKELVNPQMVRIKKAGQVGKGLEVFLQGGHYGIMRNGKVTCPPKFRRVRRLEKGCGFFALGIYLKRDEYEPEKLVEVTTVIDNRGCDLHVMLYGNVWWADGYFYGEWVGARSMFVNCWDPVGNAYYDTSPNFTRVAGVELANSHEHGSRNMPCLKLRVSTGKVSPRFNKWEMFYNHDIIIARDYLVVKRDHNHSYRIKGFLDDSVLVESDEQYGFQQIWPNGRKGQHLNRFPKEASRVFDFRRFGLQRVKT